jgi:hypothetical protein
MDMDNTDIFLCKDTSNSQNILTEASPKKMKAPAQTIGIHRTLTIFF